MATSAKVIFAISLIVLEALSLEDSLVIIAAKKNKRAFWNFISSLASTQNFLLRHHQFYNTFKMAAEQRKLLGKLLTSSVPL
jgi:hypothetical protein